MTETTHTPTSEDRSLLPWSHRRSYPVRILITILAGVASGVVGTLAHRMGAAQNIPYGLVLAFLIVGISTWCARARCNTVGIGFHLIASSGVVWCMATYGPGGDAMIPIGFSVDMPFFVENAGKIWMWGVIIIQVVMLFLPQRWFTIPPREKTADEADDGVVNDDGDVDSAGSVENAEVTDVEGVGDIASADSNESAGDVDDEGVDRAQNSGT